MRHDTLLILDVPISFCHDSIDCRQDNYHENNPSQTFPLICGSFKTPRAKSDVLRTACQSARTAV